MAWPPPVQKTDWINADVSLDNHPSAHNDIALTLEQDYTPQISANVTAISTNTGAIAAHEAVYALDGTMTGTNPGFNADAQIDRRNAAGTVYSVLDGINAPQSSYLASPGSVANSWLTVGETITIDTSAAAGCAFMVYCSVAASDLKPNESFFVRPTYRIQPADWASVPQAYYGRALNTISPGTVYNQVHAMPAPIVIDATTESIEFNIEAQTGGAGQVVSVQSGSLVVIPHWR